MSVIKRIREIWWKDNDLHVIEDNGEHVIYHNTWVTEHKLGIEDSDVVKCTDIITYKAETDR